MKFFSPVLTLLRNFKRLFSIILHIPSISWMNIRSPVYGRNFHALFELLPQLNFEMNLEHFQVLCFFSIFSIFISFSLAFIANKTSKRCWFSVTSSIISFLIPKLWSWFQVLFGLHQWTGLFRCVHRSINGAYVLVSACLISNWHFSKHKTQTAVLRLFTWIFWPNRIFLFILLSVCFSLSHSFFWLCAKCLLWRDLLTLTFTP